MVTSLIDLVENTRTSSWILFSFAFCFVASPMLQAADADVSTNQENTVLVGYPPLLNERDQQLISSYRTDGNDLHHHLRMVGWTYGDVTPQEAERIVKTLKESGFNTVISGGNRNIQSNLVANIKNSRVIAEACHKYGMCFVHHLTTTLVQESYYQEHPDQACVNIATGKPVFTSYKWWAMCLNNDDFWKSYMVRLEELFRGVPMDGVMVDEIEFWGEYTCGCTTCREKFKKQTGYELPNGYDPSFFFQLKNPAFRAWLQWRHEKIVERNLKVRKLMKKYMPHGGFYPAYTCNSAYASTLRQGEPFGITFDTMPEFASSLGLESEPMYFNYYQGWPSVVPDLKYLKASSRRTNADPWMYYYPKAYGDYTWCWFLATCMGANMWFGGEQEPEAFIAQARRPVVQWAARYQDILGNTTPFADTGLLFSLRSVGYAPDGDACRSGYVGMCQAFTDAQIAYQVLIDQDITREGLKGIKTLVAFNAGCPSDRALNEIRRFVRGGGSLITSGSISLFDESGSLKPNFGLSDLLGCSYSGSVAGKENSLRVSATNELTGNFTGEWAHNATFNEIKDLAPDCKVVGEIVTKDGAKHPGIVVRNYGKGKVVYFTGHPELKYINQDLAQPFRIEPGKFWKDRRDADFLKLVSASIRFANPEPVFAVNGAPRGVVAEAYSHRTDTIQGVVVHLANFTGSDLKEGVLPTALDFRFPTVQQPITVTVRATHVKKVFLISPDYSDTVEMNFTRSGTGVAVQLPVLHRYAILYFLQGGEKKLLDLSGRRIVRTMPEPVQMTYKGSAARR